MGGGSNPYPGKPWTSYQEIYHVILTTPSHFYEKVVFIHRNDQILLAFYIMAIISGFFPARGPEGLFFQRGRQPEPRKTMPEGPRKGKNLNYSHVIQYFFTLIYGNFFHRESRPLMNEFGWLKLHLSLILRFPGPLILNWNASWKCSNSKYISIKLHI